MWQIEMSEIFKYNTLKSEKCKSTEVKPVEDWKCMMHVDAYRRPGKAEKHKKINFFMNTMS
jgi:hypothetical protein